MARNGCTATWLYRNLAAACNCAGTVTAPRRLSQRLTITDKASGLTAPSPTISPTDPVPRGLLTLCPAASSGPQGLYTAYIQPIYSEPALRVAKACFFSLEMWTGTCDESIAYAGMRQHMPACVSIEQRLHVSA